MNRPLWQASESKERRESPGAMAASAERAASEGATRLAKVRSSAVAVSAVVTPPGANRVVGIRRVELAVSAVEAWAVVTPPGATRAVGIRRAMARLRQAE
jgi:hypothetical protein